MLPPGALQAGNNFGGQNESTLNDQLDKAKDGFGFGADYFEKAADHYITSGDKNQADQALGMSNLFTNLGYVADVGNIVGDAASGNDAGGASLTLAGDALQNEIKAAIKLYAKKTIFAGAEGPVGIALSIFDSTPIGDEGTAMDLHPNSTASFQVQAQGLRLLYAQFDTSAPANNNTSAQTQVMQLTSNFMNNGQITLEQKQQAYGYLLREYGENKNLWSPQQVQQLGRFFFQLY